MTAEGQNGNRRAASKVILALASVAGVLVVVVAASVAVLMRELRSERQRGSQPAPTETRSRSGPAYGAANQPSHEAKIAEVLGLLNETLLVPSLSAGDVETDLQEYDDKVGRFPDGVDFTKTIVSRSYLLRLCFENKKDQTLTNATVSATYHWKIAIDPKLKDVLTQRDSDIYTKEAVYSYTVRTYHGWVNTNLGSENPLLFKRLARVVNCGPRAHSSQPTMSILVQDRDDIKNGRPILSDELSSAVDRRFARLSDVIREKYRTGHEDYSQTVCEPDSSEVFVVRLRCRKQDGAWIVYETEPAGDARPR